jgi:ABC-type lipoprotein release transport system permease subunit
VSFRFTTDLRIGGRHVRCIRSDLKITVKQGKVFDYHTPQFDSALSVGVDLISETLEDNALVKYEDRQVPAVVKGVSQDFKYLADMDKLVIDGSFLLREDSLDYVTIGAGLAVALGVRAGYWEISSFLHQNVMCR